EADEQELLRRDLPPGVDDESFQLVPGELAPVTEVTDHAAEALVEFDWRALERVADCLRLEVADDLERHVCVIWPLHADGQRQAARRGNLLLGGLLVLVVGTGGRQGYKHRQDGGEGKTSPRHGTVLR